MAEFLSKENWRNMNRPSGYAALVGRGETDKILVMVIFMVSHLHVSLLPSNLWVS